MARLCGARMVLPLVYELKVCVLARRCAVGRLCVLVRGVPVCCVREPQA